jgi:hypothetical protein
MSDWGWVTLTYAVVYLTLASYTISLVRRRRQLGNGEGPH